MRLLSITYLWIFLCCVSAAPRLLVLTDIGGDPDDQQSMVRLMAYADEFEIEGLIASAAGTPGELKEQVVRPDLIREIVRAAGRARLLGVVKAGDPDRSLARLGNDTEGSRWIIAVVDRADTRPVNITIWGGAHDLAQALWRVRKERTKVEVERFVGKLRIHSIGHQDETGPWIVENFPALFFVLSSSKPGVDKRESVYRGMYLGGDESLTSRAWIEEHVKSRGALGALYPMKTWTAPNPHGCLKEGDTPSWFFFLQNGLNDPERPEWGGWGGRFVRVRGRLYVDAPEGRESVWRWRPAFQSDFAARMRGVNRGPRAGKPRVVQIREGDQVRLQGDGWRHYPAPGGQASEVRPDEPLEAGEYHFVRELREDGRVAYERVVVRVERRAGAARPTR